MITNRNSYAIQLQIVCAVGHGIASISESEAKVLDSACRSGMRNMNCDVLSVASGDRWLQIMLATQGTFDVPKAMTSIKAVTSRAIHRLRGGNAGFWSPGYIVVSIGEPVDPAHAASQLENKGTQG